MKIQVIQPQGDETHVSYKLLAETDLDYEILSELDRLKENLVCEKVERARVEGRVGHSAIALVLSVDPGNRVALMRQESSTAHAALLILGSVIAGAVNRSRVVPVSMPPGLLP